MLHSGLHLIFDIFVHDVASAQATQPLPRYFQHRFSSWKPPSLGFGRYDSEDCYVKVGTAADDGELLMLERLSSLLRTDMPHAQQQVQQELAGMPAAHNLLQHGFSNVQQEQAGLGL